MMQENQTNLAPQSSLESARYLRDPQIIEEYLDMQRIQAGQGISLSHHLRRNPKLRKRLFQYLRLALVAVIVITVFSTISQFGLWNDIYTAISTSF